jgi:hypothetical protein
VSVGFVRISAADERWVRKMSFARSLDRLSNIILRCCEESGSYLVWIVFDFSMKRKK